MTQARKRHDPSRLRNVLGQIGIYSRQKIKENFFFDGKSRGMLLARAALKRLTETGILFLISRWFVQDVRGGWCYEYHAWVW